MIQEIAIEKLKTHPKNVRKTYTGIEELADSIRAQGVLQNLTVVPEPGDTGDYWVVIGNRRLTAARAAGLKTLPCTVTEMAEKDQISTMLLENMQRSDLSVTEQAQGFQLMLDLGETEESISEKTGFSRSTVRHRVNLAKLDREILEDAEKDESFQLSLTDLYELEKIKDVETRNRILSESTNSSQIKWKVSREIEETKKNKMAEKIMGKLRQQGVKPAPKKAQEERWSGKWKDVARFDLSECKPEDVETYKNPGKLYAYRYFDVIYVVKKDDAEPKQESEWEKEKKDIARRKKQIKDIMKEMKETRNAFITEVTDGKYHYNKDSDPVKDMWQIYMELIIRGSGLYKNRILDFYGTDQYKDLENKTEGAMEKFRGMDMEKQMLVMLSDGSEPYDPTDYEGKYNGDMGTLREFYKVLQKYGFTFGSLEEIKILDGTHELYTREEEKRKRYLKGPCAPLSKDLVSRDSWSGWRQRISSKPRQVRSTMGRTRRGW